jgi:hypothetical protein
MEKQAEGLTEMVGSVDSQLKELFDDLAAEDKKNADELELLRIEHKAVIQLLNTYNIPASINGKTLTLVERLSLALKNKQVA